MKNCLTLSGRKNREITAITAISRWVKILMEYCSLFLCIVGLQNFRTTISFYKKVINYCGIDQCAILRLIMCNLPIAEPTDCILDGAIVLRWSIKKGLKMLARKPSNSGYSLIISRHLNSSVWRLSHESRP